MKKKDISHNVGKLVKAIKTFLPSGYVVREVSFLKPATPESPVRPGYFFSIAKKGRNYTYGRNLGEEIPSNKTLALMVKNLIFAIEQKEAQAK